MLIVILCTLPWGQSK